MDTDRSGFTLIEVIVVVTIITLLMALLLPAIAGARANARSTHCMNNLRQIAAGLYDYAEQNRRLPASGYWDELGTTPLRNWVVEVLSYTDRHDIFEAWDMHEAFDDESVSRNGQLAKTHIALLTCPDDSSITGDGDLSYVVNGGFAFTAIADCPRALRDTGERIPMDFNGNGIVCPDAGDSGPTDQTIMMQMGLFFLQNWPKAKPSRFHTLGSIVDGLSQTIMVSENVQAGSDGSWADPRLGKSVFYGSGYICEDGICSDAKVDYRNANNRVDLPAASEAINASLSGEPGSPWVSSYHRNRGVHFAFCDASVRFLSEDVDGSVYAALISPQGKRVRGPLTQVPLNDANY